MESDPNRHAGQWVLLDARVRLLAVGRGLYRGLSPRSSLDATARRILLPRMRAVLNTGAAVSGTVNDRGQRWKVAAEPIRGPHSGQAVVLLGCYWPDQTPAPARPGLGSWQWKATPPGPNHVTRAYWSSSLFAAYDMDIPPGEEPHGWEGPQWLDELVIESDRMATHRFKEKLLADDDGALHFHAMRVRSPRTGQQLRIWTAAWRDVPTPGPEVWLSGISMRVDGLQLGTDADVDSSSYLAATLMLVPDPMFVIDTRYEQLFRTTSGFAQLDLALPARRYVPDMCHSGDLPVLRTMLAEACGNVGTMVGPTSVRFVGTDTGWTTLVLTATAVDTGERPAHHVLCRIVRASHDPDRC